MDGFFRRFARLSLLLWSITPFVGCEVLNEAAQEAITETSMIDVTLADTILVSSPTATEIAAWYCPQNDPLGCFRNVRGLRPARQRAKQSH